MLSWEVEIPWCIPVRYTFCDVSFLGWRGTVLQVCHQYRILNLLGIISYHVKCWQTSNDYRSVINTEFRVFLELSHTTSSGSRLPMTAGLSSQNSESFWNYLTPLPMTHFLREGLKVLLYYLLHCR